MSVALRISIGAHASDLGAMEWKTIRLELAESSEFPAGSVSRGYLIRAPLDDRGSIDERSLDRAPQKATVRRFWSTEPDERGQVVRIDGHWAMRFKGKPDRLIARASRLDRIGDRIPVIDVDGVSRPFQIAAVRST